MLSGSLSFAQFEATVESTGPRRYGQWYFAAMSQSNMEIVRRFVEVVNTSTSVEEAIATGVEEFWDPEIEFVNPEDAIEGGIRRGAGGMRTALEAAPQASESE